VVTIRPVADKSQEYTGKVTAIGQMAFQARSGETTVPVEISLEKAERSASSSDKQVEQPFRAQNHGSVREGLDRDPLGAEGDVALDTLHMVRVVDGAAQGSPSATVSTATAVSAHERAACRLVMSASDSPAARTGPSSTAKRARRYADGLTGATR
jgi:hypothetical protein